MPSKQILALSSSRVGNGAYLGSAVSVIKDFLGEQPLKIAFIPFALISKNYDTYVNEVSTALKALPHSIAFANYDSAQSVIEKSDAIMVGGGNTFKLLHDMYEARILEIIRTKINAGTPYIGWSAGANITSPTIGTTNDMPVIQPQSFKALGVFLFQINPHYYNQKPEGFNGETRHQRLFEFIKMNPALKVIGLPEGTALQLQGAVLKFMGNSPGILISAGDNNVEPITRQIRPEEDLGFLLTTGEL
ncbi:MAG: dipeptidase PepE [Ginsengibacter sp.]